MYFGGRIVLLHAGGRSMRVARAEGGGIAGSRYQKRSGELESKFGAASEWKGRGASA